MRRFLIVVLCLGIFLTSITPINAYYTNMPASVVVGQPNFTNNNANQGGGVQANGIDTPFYPSSDGTKLIFSDFNNNRVLIFNSIPTTNNASANVVIGQIDFVSKTANQGGSAGAATLSNPVQTFTDGQRLFVSDYSNNRVLIWNRIPTQNNTPADIVLGQPDMNTVTSGTTASKFKTPYGIFFDSGSGKLIIVDNGNNRVLIYNSLPIVSGASADVVLGQTNFTSGSANHGNGGTASSDSLRDPAGVIIANGKLVVTDFTNNRVLIWNSIPSVSGTPADVVIGQPTFTSVNSGGTPSSATLFQPQSVYFDGRRLFIDDAANNRVLIFNNIPGINGASADQVIGQTNFTTKTTNQCNCSLAQINTLSNPNAITVVQEKLIISDQNNNRLLIFNNILSTPAMNINPPTTVADKIRIAGNISLGERPNYSMQKVTASVNGEGETNVTYLDGGRDNGPGNTLYEFYNDFIPTNRGGDFNNYTVAFKAQSFNAEEDKYFYFTPFSLDKITVENTPTISFTVNQTFRDQLKNNLIKYQVWYKKTTDKDYKLYLDNILTSQENYGKIVVKGTTKLLKGKYQFRIKAINIMNHEQVTNNLNINIKK